MCHAGLIIEPTERNVVALRWFNICSPSLLDKDFLSVDDVYPRRKSIDD